MSCEYNIKWPLIGNGHITKYLEKLIAKSCQTGNDAELSGSYIFCGQNDLGKTTTALAFSQIILCNERAAGKAVLPCGQCPACRQFKTVRGSGGGNAESIHGDLHIIEKDEEKKNISITQIREFIRQLGMSSYLGEYKIGIIKEADSLSEEAANALLKTLEEPNSRVIIILLVRDVEALPLTIKSRSQILQFGPVPADEIYRYLAEEKGVGRGSAKRLSRLAHGSPALALKLHEESGFYESYLGAARLCLDFFRQDLNERFSVIAGLTGKKGQGREDVASAVGLAAVWQSIIRDLMLFKAGQPELVKHEPLIAEIEQAANNLNYRELLNLYETSRETEKFIAANVSPKNALEYMVLNI